MYIQTEGSTECIFFYICAVISYLNKKSFINKYLEHNYSNKHCYGSNICARQLWNVDSQA